MSRDQAVAPSVAAVVLPKVRKRVVADLVQPPGRGIVRIRIKPNVQIDIPHQLVLQFQVLEERTACRSGPELPRVDKPVLEVGDKPAKGHHLTER